MTESESLRRANLAYKQKSSKNLQVRLFPRDKDIVDYMATVKDKGAYLRSLIRADMKRQGIPTNEPIN